MLHYGEIVIRVKLVGTNSDLIFKGTPKEATLQWLRLAFQERVVSERNLRRVIEAKR